MKPKMEKPALGAARITHAHVLQSTIAGMYILLVFWLLSLLHEEMIISSLVASTFIAFTFPHSQNSKPRFLIGGYFIGAISGVVCSGLLFVLKNHFSFQIYIPICALALLLAMLLMFVFHFEHPPAAALAVAMILDGSPLVTAVTALACILLLCALKGILKKHMRNL